MQVALIVVAIGTVEVIAALVNLAALNRLNGVDKPLEVTGLHIQLDSQNYEILFVSCRSGEVPLVTSANDFLLVCGRIDGNDNIHLRE